MRVIFIIYLVALIPALSWAQCNEEAFPRDTSFSVRSAGQKIKKHFPHALAVKEFQDLKIQTERDVVYYTLGKRNLHADIFYPSTKQEHKIPAIILIHGGGWASGDKSHLIPMAQKLAENGYFSATVEHRLSPEAKYPAAIMDLKTAIKWVKLNADKYAIDTTKIAVLGCSSGATLATFVGTTGQNPKFQAHPFEKRFSDQVQAIVNIDGIVDFSHPAESAKDNDPKKPSAGARWFGATYQQNPAIWKEASPLSYVNGNTPPTLFINSALPRFHAGREAYLKVLSKNNVYSAVFTIEKTPHPFWLFHPWFDETYPKVVHFLNHAFKKN